MKNNQNCKIVVPFFNDFENFKSFIDQISLIKEKEKYFLIIDNGSDDDKIEEFYLNCKKEKIVWDFIKIPKNHGFGGAIQYSIEHVDEDFIAWMPGNMKVDPLDAYNLIQQDLFKQPYVLTKSWRVERKLIPKIKTLLFSFIASIWFTTPLFDNGGTPNIMSKEILKKLDNAPSNFSFDFYIFYFFKFNRYKVLRPKVPYRSRLHGISHWQNSFKAEVDLVKYILFQKTQWKSHFLKIH